MQVNHIDDHVTHAIVGGAETVDFGISSSAEFFQILSSTLYKDQKMAVVREVLCNAWDAHIAAGITDTPVEVTITPDCIIFKDFGKGIPHDQMGAIYGTYGASTKANDGTQTGGFGLGCKAPFAYTDHFEVTSSYEGTKTIYSMSKSASEVGGKPGITKIVSVPTTDSGMTVSINLIKGDSASFEDLVEKITKYGDMNVNLNSKKLPTLDMPTHENAFCIAQIYNIYGVNRIYLRYGNVIYPIEEHPAYEVLYGSAKGSMQHLAYRSCLILQAQPNSISVTPSRESLSMQQHTINSVKELLVNYVNEYEKQYPFVIKQVAKGLIDEAVKAKNLNVLLTSYCAQLYGSIPETPDKLFSHEKAITHSLRYKYPELKFFRKWETTLRVKELAKAGLINRGIAGKFLKRLKVDSIDPSTLIHGSPPQKNSWLVKDYATPLLTKITNKPDLSTSNLYVKWAPLTLLKKVATNSIYSNIAYLNKVVVLTAGLSHLNRRLNTRVSNNLPGSYLIYQTGVNNDNKEAARKFFTDQGYTLIDLTTKTAKELAEADAIKAKKKPRVPRKKGYVAISNASAQGGFNLELTRLETAARIDSPSFVAMPFGKNDWYGHFTGITIEHSHYIAKKWGHLGAVVFTDHQYKKCIEGGALPIRDFIAKELLKYFDKNEAIKESITHSKHFSANETRSLVTRSISVLTKYPHMLEYFGIASVLNEEDMVMLGLCKYLFHKYHNHFAHPGIADFYNSITPSPESLKLAERLDSSFIETTFLESLCKFMSPIYVGTDNYVKATQILETILNK